MDLPAAWLVEVLNCRVGYAYELLNGARTPSLENAVKVIRASEKLRPTGKRTNCWRVEADFFLPDPD